MIDLIWVALIVVIVIAQLSQAKSKTQLRGRPFEPQRRAAPPTAPVEQSVRRAERVQRKEEPTRSERVLQFQGPGEGAGDRVSERIPVQQPTRSTPAHEPYPMPDLRSAVVWSEIIAPPVSKRRGRR